MSSNVFLRTAVLTAILTAPTTVFANDPASNHLCIGWATVDITPDQPVVLRGQFHARVSEGILDRVTATALALEAVEQGATRDWAVLVSCDLVAIGDELRDRVREHVRTMLPELDPTKVFLNATHTHTAPAFGNRSQDREAALAKEYGWDLPPAWADWGIELAAMPGIEYREYAAVRIAGAVEQAWKSRKPGGIGFGLGSAVVGHNRLTVYDSGQSQLYGPTERPDFRHIEGYEDHGVGLLFTWDRSRKLTGVVINVACPSQCSENLYQVSADFWHDTRKELRRRLGPGLFVLPQASAAGDQSPHLIGRGSTRENAEERMERLTGRTRRQQIAHRLSDAVLLVLPHLEKTIEWSPTFTHRVAQVEITRRQVSADDVTAAASESDGWRQRYGELRRALAEHPETRQKNRWYVDVTQAYRRMMWGAGVRDRFQLQQEHPKLSYEVHVLRIGDLAIATNPFELYLDYGVQIQQRSRAVQTFVVQLTGAGTYLPTRRSVAGGAYGAVPASTEIGPEGGRELVEQTLALIESLFPTP